MYVGRGYWAYYNEFEPYAADWIENLIRLGVVAPGIVDRRSIVDVRPDDLRGFRQCHFFAGISVWSYALRRAGIADDVAVWTGSPPCQPFSAAGQGDGVDDERHLWPALFHLIEARRPPRFYGEQVASKDGLGWLDLVQSDLEGADYALWAVDTCSASAGSPHIRQRLRLCADDTRLAAGGLEHDFGSRLEGLGDGHRPATGQRQGSLRPVTTASGVEWLADDRTAPNWPGPTNGFWRDADWLFSRDAKWRPVEPGTFPLVDGSAFRLGSGSAFEGRSRQGMLKGYGNAVDAEATIDFIEATLEPDTIDGVAHSSLAELLA